MSRTYTVSTAGSAYHSYAGNKTAGTEKHAGCVQMKHTRLLVCVLKTTHYS